MVKMNKVLFTAKDMELCFKAGERFAKDINEPNMGEYILPIYKKREANGVDTSHKTALRKHAVINCVPYQTCPKCGGDGNLLRYNSPALIGMNVPICDVCDGKKIIPMAHCL